jgi:haloacid dehalogenase superfamily, subfamily IA, variant 1 with third motif having Dx(3-4)D or Dx(3-4)E
MDDVEFVYFDLDDTLLDHSHAERKALADVRDRYLALFGTLSVNELQEQYHAINGPLWRRYADDEIDKDTLKRRRFAQLLEAVDAPHADPALVGRYYMQRYAAHWRFIPGAKEAYEAVADERPVGVMTNGFAEVQAQKFDEFPVLRERADAIVVCEEAGVLKPNPEAFAHATDVADVAPGAVLYVGDSYRSDVAGAQDVGWRVAWFSRNGTDGRSTDERGFIFDEWTVLPERFSS